MLGVIVVLAKMGFRSISKSSSPVLQLRFHIQNYSRNRMEYCQVCGFYNLLMELKGSDPFNFQSRALE